MYQYRAWNAQWQIAVDLKNREKGSLGKRDFEQGYYESVGKSGKESVAAATTANISKRNND